MHSSEWVGNGDIAAVVRSDPIRHCYTALNTGTNGHKKLLLGTWEVGAAQWARRGRRSKITAATREARHFATGQLESPSPVQLAEAGEGRSRGPLGRLHNR